jgi:hypothetical protein
MLSSFMRAVARPFSSTGAALCVFLTVLVLAASVTGAFARHVKRGAVVHGAVVHKGAVVEVKPNSIWFEEADKLTHWQELKNGGNEAALTTYQEQMLGRREAWQFLKPLKVKILRYEPATSQINVEMKTAGRMQGSTWWLDASAVGR